MKVKVNRWTGNRALQRLIISCILLGINGIPGVSQTPSHEVAFAVCGQSEEWVRPSLSEQLHQIQSNPRYQDLDAQYIENNLLWQSSILSLNTYGLSLLVDVHNLAGLWALPTDIYFEPCEVLKIDSKEIAYLILLQYQVSRVYWDNNQYVMVIKSVPQGVQVVQFPRQDKQPLVPLKVVDETGRELSVSHDDSIAGYR